jgi:acetyl-CoA carboxylase biotin carboxyl carrier protein
MAPQPNDGGAPGASTACHRYEEGNVTEVKAELVGNLWKIVVAVGQAVEEDDTLMILESMKMEIPITTPTSGTVAQILVAEGEVVQEGQTVAIID